MIWTPNRRDLLKASAATAALGLAGRAARAEDIPATPETGDIKMGIEPWLGYGQWHIAAKKGLFAKAGLGNVEIVNFNTDADINAALAAGQLQCGNIATHTAMNFIAAGLPIKIVALLDISKTADAMVSDGSVTDIKGLKGKQVAYEEGTTSDILLNYALSQNGMTIADIEKVPMPASDAGAALIGGKVPVAVTYEPYLTLAMQQNPKVRMIYSAGENPGLISDVLVVTVRKSVWASPEAEAFPHRVNARVFYGHSTNLLNSAVVALRALLAIWLRRPKVVVLGSVLAIVQ